MTSSHAMMQRLAALESKDSTFHSMPSPLVMAKGEGPWVWDVDGRKYLDLCAGFGVLALGHHPQALQKVFARYSAAGPAPIVHGMGDVYPSVDKVEFFEALRPLLPSRLEFGSLALSGGQALEIAVKTAMLAGQKSGFIAFEHSYHGLDLGVLPLTARSDFRTPFIGAGGAIVVERLRYGYASESEFKAALQRLEAGGWGFAGVVVEPVQGRGGMIEAPAGWLAALCQWAHAAGGLVILDEVLTGLGRSGKITVADEIPADLLCLGKALGGGLPLSACFGTAAVMSAWPLSNGEAIHTGTFFGHPLACALGTEFLRVLTSENLASKAQRNGEVIKSRMCERFAKHPEVKMITGSGMMLALHFHTAGRGARMMNELRDVGVIALASGSNGECIAMTPSLNIDLELWWQGIEKMSALLAL